MSDNEAKRVMASTLSTFPLPGKELKGRIQEYTMPYRKLVAYYKCAIMEVETKFKVLSEKLSLEYDRNPIETIKTRLKSLTALQINCWKET